MIFSLQWKRSGPNGGRQIDLIRGQKTREIEKNFSARDCLLSESGRHRDLDWNQPQYRAKRISQPVIDYWCLLSVIAGDCVSVLDI